MLMDEPFGAVDPIVRERLQNEFLRLQEQLAKTILFVTHDIDEAIKMGDLVAVFRAGGRRGAVRAAGRDPGGARVATFVARFVGADRGLKRLSLTRVDDLELATAVDGPRRRRRRRRPTARRSADPFPYLLLLDAADRPLGWVRRDGASRRTAALDAGPVDTTSPLLDRRTTLKDALSMLLDDDVQAGVVVDRRGTSAAS